MEHMIDPESGVYTDVCKYGRAVFTYDLLHTCLPQYADQWEHYYRCKFYGYAWTALNENVQTNSVAECKAEDELPLE
jgi:hypothetical protein